MRIKVRDLVPPEFPRERNPFRASLLVLAVALAVCTSACEPSTTVEFDPEPVLKALISDGILSDTSLRSSLLEKRIIVIVGDINEYRAQQVVEALLYLDAKDPKSDIDLYINSRGGFINDAMAIVDTFSLLDSDVNTWALGACQSSALYILSAGTGQRTVGSNSLITLHLTQFPDIDNPLSFDRVQKQRIVNFWAKFPILANNDTLRGEYIHMSPKEVLQLGLVDRIAPPKPRSTNQSPESTE